MNLLRTGLPVIVAFALGCLLATSMRAQGGGDVVIGAVTLSLGMREEDALARLGDRYDLRRSAGADNVSWQVFEKKVALAQLVFRRQRLEHARLYWLRDGDAQAGGFALANAAYGILSKKLKPNLWHACYALVGSSQTPDGEFKNVQIACPTVRLDMSISSISKFGDSASVDEVHELGGKP